MSRHVKYRFWGIGIVAVAFIISGVRASDAVVPSSEQIRWVQSKTVECRATKTKVENLLKLAKEERETVKITCLEDKLAQISSSLRGVEDRVEPLQLAHDGGKTEEADKLFLLVKIYVSRIAGLGAEADNCLGETDIVLGKTETTLTIENEDENDEDPSRDWDYSWSMDVVDPSELDHASGYY